MKIANYLAALLLAAAAGCAAPSGAPAGASEDRRETTLENGFYEGAEELDRKRAGSRQDGTSENGSARENPEPASSGVMASGSSGVSSAATWVWNQTSFSKLGFWNALLWYIPNRLSDLMDVFTIEIGAGEIGLDLQLSRYLTFGAGIGQSYMLGWSINNQFGIYQQKGWYFDCFRYRASSIQRAPTFGDYSKLYTSGKSGLVDVPAMFAGNVEDPFALGVKACCFLNLKLQVHPLELADFIGGLLFIDCPHDDNPKINWMFNLL